MKQTSHIILAVNDRLDQLELLASIIEQPEYRVLKATTPNAAVQLTTCHQPDLIIINVSKRKTALGLHRRIRSIQNLANTPILLITTDTTRIDFLDSTKDDILESSYQPITLAAKVARLVERKRAQDELDSSQQLYFDLFQNANDVVYTHDLTGRYTSLNKIGQQITGYSPEEIGGVDFRSLASPEDVELAHSMLRKKLNGEAASTVYPVSIKAKDGTMIPFEVSSQLIIKNGKPVGVQGIARDIRARKEAEEKLLQLERAQKMEAVGLLAGGVAHDINNILTAIYGGCDSLQRELGESSPLSKHVLDILEAGRRAAKLTEQLLAYSRQQVLQPVNLNVNTVITHIMDQFIARTIGEDISIICNLGDDLPLITADKTQLETILINLAVNARQAMPDGGTITIETSLVYLGRKQAKKQNNAHVQLSISDTGIGMSPETQKQVFDPFFTTKPEGSGLGLAMAFGYVKQSEGSISVSSKLGEGSTFLIQFPAAKGDVPETTMESAPAPIEELQGTQTILIAEDDEPVRQVVKNALTHAGYKVLEAFNGAHALEVLKEHSDQVQLVITDCKMPHMCGQELALQISGTVHVLFISGYSRDVTTDPVFLVDGVNLLTKPFTGNQLLQAVRKILSLPKTKLTRSLMNQAAINVV
jgi:two-component system, cell cycle sensor histidine kinase and response regulator CckA